MTKDIKTQVKQITIDGYPIKHYEGDASRNKYRWLLLFLVDEYGVCFHCGRRVTYWEHQDFKTPPLDSATIDHLTTKTQRKKGQTVEKVLACWECNQTRNGAKIWKLAR